LIKTKRVILESELIEKEWLNSSYYRLRFLAPEIVSVCQPGQFVNVRFSHFSEPLLRRPLSIFRCHSKEGWLEFLVKVIGKGTKLFSQAEPGASFDLLGPLGHGFEYQKNQPAILVGGGIGIAPLVFLAEVLHQQKTELVFLQGFRTAAEICCINEVKQLARLFIVTTDDGSYGLRGLVTDRLLAILQAEPDLKRSVIYACGPTPMLRAISVICNQLNLAAQFSLEAYMACGFGACVGCAVPASNHSEYRLVCVDGPVFHEREIDFGS